MDREAEVLQDRVEVAALERRLRQTRRNGFEVTRMKRWNAAAIQACTASTLAFSVAGRLPPNAATSAPNSARIRTQSSIEPSWFPHTPVNL